MCVCVFVVCKTTSTVHNSNDDDGGDVDYLYALHDIINCPRCSEKGIHAPLEYWLKFIALIDFQNLYFTTNFFSTHA